MKTLGFLTLLVLAVVYGAYSYGYVCLKFYNWFLLTTFTSLPPITFHQAVGVMFFIKLFQIDSPGYKDDSDSVWEKVFIALAAPWIILLIGLFFK